MDDFCYTIYGPLLWGSLPGACVPSARDLAEHVHSPCTPVGCSMQLLQSSLLLWESMLDTCHMRLQALVNSFLYPCCRLLRRTSYTHCCTLPVNTLQAG